MQEFVPAPPRVVPYDPAWPRAYQQEADLIADALVGVPHAIEHIGSTAVPGLPAKPVIDLMVGVADYRRSTRSGKPCKPWATSGIQP